MTICDPACGTGGFFLATHDYLSTNYLLDPDQKRHLRFEASTAGKSSITQLGCAS